MRALPLAALLLAAVHPAASLAGSLSWTCPCGGEVLQFDPRDPGYMQSMTSAHEAEHCGGGSSGGFSPSAMPSTGDPMIDMLMPVIGGASQAIGESIAREIFGFTDPAEQARRAELQRQEQARLAEIERQRQAELERQRRERHQRLLSDMSFLGSTNALPLLGLSERDGPASGADGPLELLPMDDGLRPAGTSFFGLGGGAPAVPRAGRAIELRDLRRAAYMVGLAESADPAERDALIDEALRAASGDASLVAEAPAGFALRDADGKLVDLRRELGTHGDAERGLRNAQNRLARAEWLADAAASAETRVARELAQLSGSGASAQAVAGKRELLERLSSAARNARAELELARREAQIAQSVFEIADWSRRQRVLALGDAPFGEPDEAARSSQSKLERIYARKIEVPSPEIAGSIARAENGRRALDRVAALEPQLAALPEAQRESARERLERARHRAELMAHYDELINLRTRERVDALRELDASRRAANQRVQSLAAESVDTLGGAVAGFRGAGEALLSDPAFQKAGQALALEEKLADAKGLADELSGLRQGLLAGEFDFELRTKLSQRAATLGTELAESLATLRGADPALAGRLAARSTFWIGAGQGLLRASDHTHAILELHQSTRFLDDQLGDAAVEARKLKSLYERQVDGFVAERRALEGLVSAHAVPASAAATALAAPRP